jgi:hypothetical protein
VKKLPELVHYERRKVLLSANLLIAFKLKELFLLAMMNMVGLMSWLTTRRKEL